MDLAKIIKKLVIIGVEISHVIAKKS